MALEGKKEQLWHPCIR